MRLSDKTLLITFYSYKGGVGRTMAVANAACQMANKHGKDVICVDWDLEAPGLHQYFNYSDEELADRPGLLDYLMDFALQVKRGAEGRVPELNDYIQDLKPEHQEGIKFGSVRFIHCGRTDADYMTRVEQFDWDEFYADLDGYRIIETLKKQLREAANVTLIDARAGQADVGVVPTIQVPDALVILFTSNRQNLIGMEEMARSFHKHPQRIAQQLPNPRILLVPARVFHEEERLQKWIDEVATPVYDRLVEDGIVSWMDQPEGLWQCYLTVESKYSVGESLVVLDESPDTSRLRESYVDLAQALENLFLGLDDIWAVFSRESSAEDLEDEGALRAELERAVERGDGGDIASLQLSLGSVLAKDGRPEEAKPMLQASLSYCQDSKRDTNPLELVVRLALGTVYGQLGEPRRTIEFYEQALVIAREIGNRLVEGAVLSLLCNPYVDLGEPRRVIEFGEQAAEIARDFEGRDKEEFVLSIRLLDEFLVVQGNAYVDLGEPHRAIECYREALAVKREIADRRGEGCVLFRMGLALDKLGQRDDAIERAEAALEIFERIEDPNAETVRKQLAKWREDRGDG